MAENVGIGLQVERGIDGIARFSKSLKGVSKFTFPKVQSSPLLKINK